MSETKKKARMEVEIYCQDRKGKYFLCPDGVPRRLDDFFVIDDRIHLNFDPARGGESPMTYQWPVADFDQRFKPFQSISQQQAQGKTPLDSTANNAVAKQSQAMLPASFPAVPTADVLTGINEFIDPAGHLGQVATGLMDAFNKLKTTPTYATQADAQVNIAKQIIDIAKTRVVAAKMILDAQRNAHS